MELHLKIVGLILVVLALIHVVFPKHFDWHNNLKTLSLINRQIMYVHTFFIGLTVLLMGILCLTSSAELVSTALGNKICLGFGIFWFCRLLIQFFGYSSELWRGKIVETFVHIVFTGFWTYFTGVFWWIYKYAEIGR